MGLRIGALIVDSQDPGRLARFWAEALDWVISQDEDPEWVVEPPEGSREDCVVADLLFIKVPEPKTSKNRLHLDLRLEHQFAEVARLEGLGATRVDVGQGNNKTWVVMADPEATSSAYKMPIRRRSEHSGYSGTRPTSRFAPERNGPDGRPAASLPASHSFAGPLTTEPNTDVEAEMSTMTVRLGPTCRTPNEPDSRVGATASMSLASTSIATVMQKSRPAARAPTRAVAGRCTDGSGCRSGRCQRRAASGPCPPPCNARTRSQVRPGRSSR